MLYSKLCQTWVSLIFQLQARQLAKQHHRMNEIESKRNLTETNYKISEKIEQLHDARRKLLEASVNVEEVSCYTLCLQVTGNNLQYVCIYFRRWQNFTVRNKTATHFLQNVKNTMHLWQV